MKNYVQPGNTVTLVTGTNGLASGDVYKLDSLIGVVCADAGPASEVEVALVGVFDLPKAAEEIGLGAGVYWDGLVCTATEASNTLLGSCVKAAGTNDATVRVRLNGVAVW